MRKNVNTENIEGRIFDCSGLKMKTVQDKNSVNFGKEFIQGELTVATDEAGLNVIPVHYTYITEYTKNGNKNGTYAALKKIIESGTSWSTHGKEAAPLVRLNPSAALNDFYPNGGDELVSMPRNEGGFVTLISELKPEGEQRQKFTFDVLINGFEYVEADPEKNITEDYAKLRCVIFNFRNDILPFTLIAKDPNAINYFENLEPSQTNLIYTQVWGEIKNTTIKTEKITESAFGAPSVDIVERHMREWVVTGARPEPYVFGLEETITTDELKKAIANRNVYLENEKTRTKEYYANKNAGKVSSTPSAIPTANTQVPTGGFNF